jgi:hypothetical protein
VPEDCKETIFEGVVFSDSSAFVDSHYDRVNDTARKQMKQTHTGASAAKWKAYNAKYGMQASQIIEGFTVVDNFIVLYLLRTGKTRRTAFIKKSSRQP